MSNKPTIHEEKDDQGNALVTGALYAVYQTNDIPSAGLLLWYAADGDWIDAETDDWFTIPQGEFPRGRYEYAHRQNASIRTDMQKTA